MNITRHPTLEQLTGFADTPEAQECKLISHHLIQCDVCRSQVSKLTNFKDTLLANLSYISSQQESERCLNDSGITDQLLLDYMRENLEEGKKSILRKKILSNKENIKQALHFQLHSSVMRQHLEQNSSHSLMDQPGENENSSGSNIVKNQPNLNSNDSRKIGIGSKLWRIATHIFSYNDNRSWAVVPLSVTLGVVVTLMVVLLAKTPHTTAMVIAAYQDNPTLTYQNSHTKIPGTGFFNRSQQSIQPFNNIIFDLKEGKELHIQWPLIPDTQQFTFKVYRIDSGNRTLINDIVSSTSEVQIMIPELSPGRRFEWELSGSRLNRGQFHTQGGFVIANKVK